MKALLKLVTMAIIGFLVYFLAWPVPIEPAAWDAPKFEGLNGVFAVNQKLANYETIDIDGLNGPEAVTANSTGDIYATTHEGWVLRWTKGAQQAERWVDVGGRPLGIAFDDDDNLWVANAYIGLQKVDTSGAVTLELDSSDGVPIRYADDLDIMPNGKIYLSDASTKFPANSGGTLAGSMLEIMEHEGTGRVIEFDPASGQSRVIMRDLTFSNGIAAPADGSFIMVAETGSYRIWKYWLQGLKTGQSEVIADNLPGFPDNIHLGQNGRFWVGLTSPRSDVLDAASGEPFKRKIMQRLPSSMRPQVGAYGHVLAIDSSGKVLTSLQDPEGSYPATTGAWETDDYLYVSSLTADTLVRYQKADLGL